MTTDVITAWLATQATGIAGARVANLVRDATVVGLGTSTREAHETFRVVEDTTFALFDAGFTVLAIADSERVCERYDHYVNGDDGVDLPEVLRSAWGPWRTAEFRAALERIRRHNDDHPQQPVRIMGTGPARALPSDYDDVTRLARRLVPDRAPRIAELLDTIRVAHDSGEHVQRAAGAHDGTPYVEVARTARTLAAPAAEHPGGRDMLRLLDGIVAYHANAIGQQYDLEEEERRSAARILEHRRRTGARIVIWDGVGHLMTPPDGAMLGAHLKHALGSSYAAVAVVFGTGTIRERLNLPAPAPGSLEATLGQPSHQPRVLDLRADVPAEVEARMAGPWRLRVIAGVYRPDADGDAYMTLPSLKQSLDGVVFVPEVTPTTYVS